VKRGSAAARLALAVAGAVAWVDCHREAAPVPAVADATAAPRRRIARREAPFSHPLLAGATTETTHEDCSRSALAAVVRRAIAIEAKADPSPAGRAGSRAASKARAGASCPSAAAEEAGKVVRGELLTRVGACVAKDGPLDPEWDMVDAAVLALGVCLECRRGTDEQTAQCRRAAEVLERAGKAAAPGAEP
jgi:hypothetical protein